MVYVRDGLSFSNENSTLADAIARFLASRKAELASRPDGGNAGAEPAPPGNAGRQETETTP